MFKGRVILPTRLTRCAATPSCPPAQLRLPRRLPKVNTRLAAKLLVDQEEGDGEGDGEHSDGSESSGDEGDGKDSRRAKKVRGRA